MTAVEGDPDTAAPIALSLPVAAVARRLGVAPATLRTWARRYGLEPTGHVPGRHRRYTAGDLARLEIMQRALTHGAGPAEAARLALAARATAPTPIALAAGPATHHAADPAVATAVLDAPAPRRGGRLLRLSDAGPGARGLARAAFAMDAQAVRGVLAESVAADGLVVTWDDVARPVLVAVAERWESNGRGVEIEHLVSDCVTSVYNAHSVGAPVDTGLRPVLLAAMPGELHVLPLNVLSAVLAERGLPCRPLGADLPAVALVDAVRRVAPAALVLWSQMAGSGDPEVVESLPRTRPRHRVFVGGTGWDGVALPSATTRLTSLAQAADVLTRVVAG
ncbi:MerR family transcriptional regulator [Pseudonocardia sulfidoxydans NBRC 16205]|uniref:MerR family transcriptional regulator n=2 Tax=Pseudonocardia sulfidoxydans TaxID=54011 RepID=A0A511DDC1_9PSEU|nr:MerR family transcriptional regulator [Pseudonocardia sulfidoxydans]GEL22799.1 MerR family transcriptional regulator [Pseudonocardia sulfidoxydans NBRC 16205]